MFFHRVRGRVSASGAKQKGCVAAFCSFGFGICAVSAYFPARALSSQISAISIARYKPFFSLDFTSCLRGER